MFKFLATKALGFLPLKGWIVGLVLALSASTAVAGYLLLDAKQEVGLQKGLLVTERVNIERWKDSNEMLVIAYNSLNQKLLERDRRNKQVQVRLDDALGALAGVEDETNCSFTTMADDVLMQFKSARDRPPE